MGPSTQEEVDTVTAVVEFPEGNDGAGSGPVFEVVVREDVLTLHGNVSVTAGRYQARQFSEGAEGDVVVWSPNYHARGDRGGMLVCLPPWSWTFPGEPVRPIPEHDCLDNLRSGVAGGVFCGICKDEVL